MPADRTPFAGLNADAEVMHYLGGPRGNGYATDAANEACRIAFVELGLPEIVSFTVADNQRSRNVMDRLGMHHDPAEDFEHPRLVEGHPLRHHVLYRLPREKWV